MLRRNIIGRLYDWKNSKDKKCLVVCGPRQVGKTTAIREFGKNYYEYYVELNLMEHPEYKTIFQGEVDSDSIITSIRLVIPDARIRNLRTLIFIDEIQESPEAVAALMHLRYDRRFDIICACSNRRVLADGLKKMPRDMVDTVDMTSLDFREFLWALGIEDEVIEDVRTYLDKGVKVPEAIHQQMMTYLRQYMVIGGMPDVVNSYLQEKDYYAADIMQRVIYRDYCSDIARNVPAEMRDKAEKCFASIPAQLEKENHKFQYGIVEPKGNARKFGKSLDWIIDNYMAFSVKNVEKIAFPLKKNAAKGNIRVYPADIGMLICTYDYSIKQALLNDEASSGATDLILKTIKGGLYEALVADMLVKNGHNELFFYRNAPGTVEMEFLVENENGVIPMEIKAGRTRSKALASVLRHEEIGYGFRLSSGNVEVAEKRITLPLYMAMFL